MTHGQYRTRISRLLFPAWVLFLSASSFGAPGVVLDGSLGPASVLAGPNYTITAAMGRQIGPNLFQSFSDFNLTSSESATFTGPANVQNIIARVTGGGPSSIDGTITSQIAGANLFLLNPAGVMFGPDAQVNVTGSITMTDDASIAASTYVSGQGGNITVHALQLNMSGTSTISADTAFGGTGNGGNVVVDTGSLFIQGTGNLVLALNLFPLGLTGITAQNIGGSGNAGSVTVSTGAFSLSSGAAISNVSIGNGSGGPISITCTDGQLSNQSEVTARLPWSVAEARKPRRKNCNTTLGRENHK